MKNYLGPYSTGGVIQLALEIMEEQGLQASEIDQITATIVSYYRLVDPPFSSRAPKDYWEASYAIPWLVAMHVLHGVDKAGPEFFTEEALSDPAALDLAQRVQDRVRGPGHRQGQDGHHPWSYPPGVRLTRSSLG